MAIPTGDKRGKREGRVTGTHASVPGSFPALSTGGLTTLNLRTSMSKRLSSLVSGQLEQEFAAVFCI